MVVYNYSGKEINAKIVYYGPALSGKTTNLEWIYSKIPTEYSGKMVSLRTQADRTIFFDFLPLELGLIDGYKTRFMLYTVPGQVYYNATRKMVLKGVDGLVFVADSQEDRVAANLESWQNLKENLAELGLDAASLPVVLQWNKRDLPGCVSPSDMDAQLNEFGVPTFEASALTGEGVYETLHRICRMIYHKLTLGDHATAPGGDETADPATSLFGEAIAARLQELDLPMPEPEPVAVPTNQGFVQRDSTSAMPVMDAILGNAGGEAHPDSGDARSGSTGAPSGRSGAAGSPPAQPAAPPPPAAGRQPHRPGTSPGSQPTAPIPHMAAPPRPSPPPSSRPARDEDEENALVSDLVDQVLVQLDETQPQAPPPAPPSPTTGSHVPPRGNSTHAAPAAPPAPGSDMGASSREAAMDSRFWSKGPASGATGPGSPESPDDRWFAEPGAPHLEGTQADRPPAGPQDSPEIEHDVDLFERMSSDSRGAAGIQEQPNAAPELEEFDLITDPLRRSTESNAESSRVSSARPSSVPPFGGPIKDAKVLEVPITLDADALSDGKTIRIVLNLQVKR